MIFLSFSRKYEELSKLCDETKEQFTAFEQQDVRCREDLKHNKSKTKKLEKTLEMERKKVRIFTLGEKNPLHLLSLHSIIISL